MARKKPEPKPVPEVEAVEAKKPKFDGRAALAKGSPVKSWSGGMTAEEAEKYEQVAAACRDGIAPRFTLRALGIQPHYRKLRKQGHPAYQYILECWNQGIASILSEIRKETSWQAKMAMLERTEPLEFAVDSSIRQAIVGLAQDTGLDVADLNDFVRLIKKCSELEIDLGAFVTEELAKRDREALEIAS